MTTMTTLMTVVMVGSQIILIKTTHSILFIIKIRYENMK